MKTLSLAQPWASLAVTKHPVHDHAVKDWETRSWKPSKENLGIIQRDGMLIHASLAKHLGKKPARISLRELCYKHPFSDHITGGEGFDLLPFGFIIGRVKVGRIIPTEQWLYEAKHADPAHKTRWDEQERLGDYSAGRYAWEMTSFEKFEVPVPMVGKLSLWDFAMCKICGCWENDACIHPILGNCHWAAEDLCSHCAVRPGEATRYSKLINKQQNSIE